MALKVLNPGTATPLGQFDALDAQTLTMKGGEVCTFTTNTVVWGGTDKAAADEMDGYAGTTTKYRPAVTNTLGTGAGGPYFLSDDGTANYGTLFGSVVGGTAGQLTSGSVLGPHTATGSGKITLWGAEGLYGVTLDAVDASTLAPSVNITPGTALTATTAGLLGTGGTANSGGTFARFVEFATDGSLVKTPNHLVAAINSPLGDVDNNLKRAFTMAVIYWLGN